MPRVRAVVISLEPLTVRVDRESFAVVAHHSDAWSIGDVVCFREHACDQAEVRRALPRKREKRLAVPAALRGIVVARDADGCVIADEHGDRYRRRSSFDMAGDPLDVGDRVSFRVLGEAKAACDVTRITDAPLSFGALDDESPEAPPTTPCPADVESILLGQAS